MSASATTAAEVEGYSITSKGPDPATSPDGVDGINQTGSLVSEDSGHRREVVAGRIAPPRISTSGVPDSPGRSRRTHSVDYAEPGQSAQKPTDTSAREPTEPGCSPPRPASCGRRGGPTSDRGGVSRLSASRLDGSRTASGEDAEAEEAAPPTGSDSEGESRGGTRPRTVSSPHSCPKRADVTSPSSVGVGERDGTTSSSNEKEDTGVRVSATAGEAKQAQKALQNPCTRGPVPGGRGGTQPRCASPRLVTDKGGRDTLLSPLKCPGSSDLFMQHHDVTSTSASSVSVSLQNGEGSSSLVPDPQEQKPSEAGCTSWVGDSPGAFEPELPDVENETTSLAKPSGGGLLSCCFSNALTDDGGVDPRNKASDKEKHKDKGQNCGLSGEATPRASQVGEPDTERGAVDTAQPVAFSPVSFQPGQPSALSDHGRSPRANSAFCVTPTQRQNSQKRAAARPRHSGSSCSDSSRKGNRQSSRASRTRSPQSGGGFAGDGNNSLYQHEMGGKGGFLHFLTWCGQPCSWSPGDSSELVFVGSPKLHRKRALPGRARITAGEEGDGGLCGWGLADEVFRREGTEECEEADAGGVRSCGCTPYVRGRDGVQARARETDRRPEEDARSGRRETGGRTPRRGGTNEAEHVKALPEQRALWRYEDESTGKAYIYQEFVEGRNVRSYAWVRREDVIGAAAASVRCRIQEGESGYRGDRATHARWRKAPRLNATATARRRRGGFRQWQPQAGPQQTCSPADMLDTLTGEEEQHLTVFQPQTAEVRKGFLDDGCGALPSWTFQAVRMCQDFPWRESRWTEVARSHGAARSLFPFYGTNERNADSSSVNNRSGPVQLALGEAKTVRKRPE